MPAISARALSGASTLLKSGLARAAFARYLRRQLGSHRWQPPNDFASLTRRKPDQGVLGWMTTDPTVWRPQQPVRLDGPLEGRRLVVKDSFDVQGAAGSSGALIAHDVAHEDAVLVERTRVGGAMLVGKVQMTELGVGGLGVQPHFGTLDNPVAPGFLPGGSSSGTAVAVANGSADFGIGTDALGSVRIPAAFCGLVGLKPTQGAVSLRGYHCVAPSLDCPGPIARTAEDCAALWRVMNDSSRPVWGVTARPPKRVGLVEQLAAIPVWRPIADAQARILKKLGCQQATVTIDLAYSATHAGGICAARELADALAVRPIDMRHATPLVHFSSAMGRSIPTWLYDSALGLRQRLRQQVLHALDGVDVLAMPTTAIPPVAASPEMVEGGVDTDAMLGVGAFTPLASVTGLPAITVPTGQGADGRPLAMMFMARPGGEERLLAIAAAVESVR